MASARAVFDLVVSTAGVADGAISAHTVTLGSTAAGGAKAVLESGRGLAIKTGGFADLARSSDLDALQAFTVEVTATPARLGAVQRLLDGQTPPIALFIDADGTPVGSVHDARGWHEVRPAGAKLAAGHAAALRLSRDAQGVLHLELDGKEVAKAGPTGPLVPVGAAGISIGAAAGTHAQGFEGTIAAATVRAAAVSSAGLAAAEQQRQATAASLTAKWKVPVRLYGDADLVAQRFSQVRAILHACGVDDLASLDTLRIAQRTQLARGTVMVAPRRNAAVSVDWGAIVKQLSVANLAGVRNSLGAIARPIAATAVVRPIATVAAVRPIATMAAVRPIAAAVEVKPVAAVHAAELVRPLPAPTLARIQAVPVKDFPVFTAAPTRVLSEVMIPVASSVIIAHRLDLTNQTLVIEPDVTTLYIIAEEVVAGPGAAITWRRPASTPPDRGADGSLDGRSYSGVVTSDGSRNGVRGGDGRDGGPGLGGVAGHDAPSIEIWAKHFTGIPNIDLAGQPGGRGGRGQPGGTGGRGGDGAGGEWWWFFGIHCWKDPGNGGDGGNGGRGGRGGGGATGGNAGNITLAILDSSLAALTTSGAFTLTQVGGTPGTGGPGGPHGHGGPGGAIGANYHDGQKVCDGGVTGHKGYDGDDGPIGSPGSPGASASTRILTITEADWNEELTRPWLTQISPRAAYPGTPLVISGARFVAGDHLIIDGAIVSWSLRSDGAIGATLPVTSTGGAKQLYMKRGDGSESNRLSVNVLPQIVTAPASVTVGQPVTLTGHAFLTGAHVVYAGTSYPAIVDSAASLRFTVPGSTTASSAARTVTYQVVNPDGSPSNIMTAQLPSTLANGFEIGVHDYQFVNPDRGSPTWDTYMHTFGELEVMHELLDPVFGHPILTAAFYAFYHKFLLGTGGGGLATGFCTSMAATALDRFWTGHNDTHTAITLTDDMRTQLTTVHGRLLSKETLLSLHAQGRSGTANVTSTFRTIEHNFKSGGTRETAPLLFFIPSGDIWDSGYFDKLSSSHCIVPVRIVYPLGSDGTNLDGVELYCWDNNVPGNPATLAAATNCRVELRQTSGEIRFDYFPGGGTREFCSEDGITLGTLNLGEYLLSDVDLPFSGPLGLSSFIVEFLLSPATMTVTDGDGKITGQVGHQLLSQIPDSHPGYLARSLFLLPQSTALTRSITGTASGTYDFHSLNPGGMSLSLSNVATTAGEIDGVVTSPDGSRVVIVPGSAKSFDVALGRTVEAQRRGIALVGVRGDAASNIDLTVAPDLSVVRFSNAGPAVTVGLRAIGVDGGSGVSAKVSRDGIAVPTGHDLVVAVSDWAKLADGTLLHSVVPPG